MDELEMSPKSTPAEESAEAEIFPMSAAGGKDIKPGDVIRIKVTAVNDDGTFSGQPDEGTEKGEEEPVTINKMKDELAAFDGKGVM